MTPTSDLDVALAAFLEDRAAGVPLDVAVDRYLAAADRIIRARLEPLS